MDGKGGKKRPRSNGRTILLKTLKQRKQLVTFVRAQRRTLIAGFLITAIIVLLFGIVSQLRGPSNNDMPDGATALNYSTFLQQISENNVLAVSLRGNEVNALLAQPVGQQAAKTSASQRAADVAAWTRYMATSTTSNWDLQGPDFAPGREVYTLEPPAGGEQLTAALISKHVTVITQSPPQTPAWVGTLLQVAPLFLVALLLVMVLFPRPNQKRLPHNVNEQIAQFTRKRAWRFEGQRTKPSASVQKPQNAGNSTSGVASRKAFTPSNAASVPPIRLAPPTTFADVAGIDEVRAELEEIVQFLRTPEKFDRLGARIPRGVLLVGPPGTGKTLLARAVAGEADVPFFSISASEFVEMFVGVGASRVRDLFQQARQAAPAVIFIDEIDAVGRKRAMKAMGNDERDQTLNQLLVEMDGFQSSQAVVVMAATNRVDILDKALLRAGRFDRHITVSPPDRAGRQAILQIHSAQVPLHAEVSLERLARLTTGMTGADLANLVNEAALCAARKDLEQVDHACFEEALARVQLGALRPLLMSEEERRIIAYHEGGHALVAHYLKEADTVNRVTILPRGQSLGVTQFVAEEDRYNYSRETLMARIAVGLGGRTAEELTLGRERVTTGAENDFQVVTTMARRMVTRWGMSDEVGVVYADYDETGAGLNMRRLDPAMLTARTQTLAVTADGYLFPDGAPELANPYTFAMTVPSASATSSPALSTLVDREIKKILDEGHALAQHILETHIEQLHLLANVLMEREQLGREEFEALLRE